MVCRGGSDILHDETECGAKAQSSCVPRGSIDILNQESSLEVSWERTSTRVYSRDAELMHVVFRGVQKADSQLAASAPSRSLGWVFWWPMHAALHGRPEPHREPPKEGSKTTKQDHKREAKQPVPRE